MPSSVRVSEVSEAETPGAGSASASGVSSPASVRLSVVVSSATAVISAGNSVSFVSSSAELSFADCGSIVSSEESSFAVISSTRAASSGVRLSAAVSSSDGDSADTESSREASSAGVCIFDIVDSSSCSVFSVGISSETGVFTCVPSAGDAMAADAVVCSASAAVFCTVGSDTGGGADGSETIVSLSKATETLSASTSGSTICVGASAGRA